MSVNLQMNQFLIKKNMPNVLNPCIKYVKIVNLSRTRSTTNPEILRTKNANDYDGNQIEPGQAGFCKTSVLRLIIQLPEYFINIGLSDNSYHDNMTLNASWTVQFPFTNIV